MKNNFNPFPVLEGKRLVLKKLDDKHADAIFNYQSDKDNFPYVDMPVYDSIEDAKEYIKKMNRGVDEDKWIIWVICLKSIDNIIGTVSIWNLNSQENKAELGYGIFPEHRKQGYMAEALSVAVDYAFNTMDLDKIEAYTNHKNKPSIEFLKHMRFDYIDTIEDEYSNNALMDIYVTLK